MLFLPCKVSPPALHKAETREKRKSDAQRFVRPVSGSLFTSAGLSWRCLDAFIRLDIHPSNNRPCIPKKARQTYYLLILFPALSGRHHWGRRAAAAGAGLQAVTGLPVPGDGCQVCVSWAPVISQSCCLLAPRGLLTFHLD